MKRHNMSKLQGEDSMQRTNRMVLGLMAVFVLGGSLVLLSCGGDDTTDINASNAASQLGGKQFIFTAETDFGVTVSTCEINHSESNNLILNDATSTSNGPTTISSFSG